MTLDLSEAERRLIAAIVAGEKAWTKVEALAEGGHSLETIADLMLRKILEKWDHPDDHDSVTLAPFGAYVWEALKMETLELAERPCTVRRKKRVHGKVVKVHETERVNFWVEGGKPDRRRRKWHVEDYGLMAELVRDRSADPELMLDEVTGDPVELFTRLFDGTKVKGIPVKIDPKLKGVEGGAKDKPKARRRAS